MAEEKKSSGIGNFFNALTTTITNAVNTVSNIRSFDFVSAIDSAKDTFSSIKDIGNTFANLPHNPDYVPPESVDMNNYRPSNDYSVMNNNNSSSPNFSNNFQSVQNWDDKVSSVLGVQNSGSVAGSSGNYIKNNKGQAVGNNRIARGLADNDYTLHTDSLILSKNTLLDSEISDRLGKTKLDGSETITMNSFLSNNVPSAGVSMKADAK